MSLPQILNHLNRRSTPLFPKLSLLTKSVFIFLVIVSVIFLGRQIFAEENVIKYTQDAQKSGNNSESWQLNSWNTTAINALTSLTGEIPFDDKGNMDLLNYKPAGMIGVANNMVASLYNPQASGIQYVAQLKNNFLGKPSYAQGVGFRKDQGLQPLLPMWKSFRNIVYVLSSVVFIVIGIMVMLRVKISPQAVVTIQSAIPGLITSLILVTFSYAIAGLVIDISYFLQSIAIALLFQAKGVELGSNLFSGWSGGIPITNVGWFAKIFDFQSLSDANFTKLNLIASGSVPITSMFSLASAIGQVVLGNIVGGLLGILGNGGNLVGQWIGGVVGGVLIGIIGGILMIVILLIMIIIWMIKLWFGLLKAYVSIIISIVTAPFIIGMGSFPNSKIGFSSWFIDLISKVAIFPVVLVGTIFIGYLAEIVGKCNLWAPNLLNMDLQITSGICNGNLLGAAVGLAGLAMLSKLPDLVPQAMFMLKPSPFGQAIGEGLVNGGVIKQIRDIGNTVKSEGTTNIMRSFGTKYETRGQTGIKEKVTEKVKNVGDAPETK